mgnify:CR=1 FL=1
MHPPHRPSTSYLRSPTAGCPFHGDIMSKRFRLTLSALALLAVPNALLAQGRFEITVPAPAHARSHHRTRLRRAIQVERQSTDADSADRRDGRSVVRGRHQAKRRRGAPLSSTREAFGFPVRSLRDVPRRRVLGATVRQRLYQVRARRRPHRLAAHGPVGGTALATIARQHLRRPREGDVRSQIDRRRSSSSPTK